MGPFVICCDTAAAQAGVVSPALTSALPVLHRRACRHGRGGHGGRACHAHPGGPCAGRGIKGLLLLGRQHGIEGLGGLAAAVGLGGVLCTHGAHAVDALGGGELVQFLAVQTAMAIALLHGSGEAVPGRFLVGGQLELLLERGSALGHVGLVALAVFARALAGIGGGCRTHGGRVGRGGLCQHRQGQGSEDGGGNGVAGQESHGESPFRGRKGPGTVVPAVDCSVCLPCIARMHVVCPSVKL